MAAPVGNDFWKLRTTVGRPKMFEDPQSLWLACTEYFEATAKRVWSKKDWVGKDAMPVDRETSVPFTLTGLFIFLDISAQCWKNWRDKKDDVALVEIVTRVEQIIYNQKFEGAAVGAYNANIIARDLGLKDQKVLDHKGNLPKSVDLSKLTEQELIAYRELTAKIEPPPSQS